MTIQIKEVHAEPVLEQLRLEADGEFVAQARPLPHSPIGGWRIEFGDGLFVGARDEGMARGVLDYIGGLMTPPLTVINGPEELVGAPLGSEWTTEYNGGNRYRLTENGEWQYRTPATDEDDWTPCLGANNDGPWHRAYPLTLVTA